MTAMSDDVGKASDPVYEALLRDLMRGEWADDVRLKASDLADRYDATSGAVREALLRLAAEGFVRNPPHRGFRTISSDPHSLWERANLRIALETEGARQSIEKGDLAWEANLSAAHHRLTHMETRLRDDRDRTPDSLALWSMADLGFHEALISACGSDLLMAEQRRAFMAFRLHLNSLEDDWGFRGADLVNEHGAILDAALNRDAAACEAAIRAHFDFYPETLKTRGLRVVVNG